MNRFPKPWLAAFLFFPLWANEPIAAGDTAAEDTAAGDTKIDFNQDLRPILSDHCFACHGPDADQRKGGLRLDQQESALAAADSGDPAIVPGDVELSTLVARIESSDQYEIMPPPEMHKPLSPAQIEILKNWIAQGAVYEKHWSFTPPQRHPTPNTNLTTDSADPIEQFIFRGIENAALTPNERAGANELMRRVTFDLTGLPPTIEAVEAFVNDPSPDAYEKVVDGLLESPRFGEHMARYWLDLVRYGDTHGLHLDNYREMWPYRDWVIEAFNSNQPYDAFITAQLAGDLLPGDDLSNKIASGYNRLNVSTNEGGSIYDEVFARNVIDRTDAFGTVFLGLTTGCAVCHDHKFDPISQEDFFSLSAFFNSLDGQAMDGNIKDHPPFVRVPTNEDREKLVEVQRMRAELEAQKNGPLPTVDEAETRWAKTIATDELKATEWTILKPASATSSGGSEMTITDDGQIKASGQVPAKETVTIEAELPAGQSFQLIRLEALTDDPEQRVGRSENGNAVLNEIEVAIRNSETGEDFVPVNLVYAEADFEQGNSGKFGVDFAIDGKIEADSGWAVGGHEKTGPRSAWFVARSPLDVSIGTTTLRVTLKYESVWAGHSFKDVRLAVSSDLPRVSEDRQLKVGPWSLVGPFELESFAPGYYQTFASQGGEFKADETFHYRDQDYQWRELTDYQPAAVNSLPTVQDRASVTLLHRRITAPDDQKVELLLGTEDGYQVWLRGTQVAEYKGARELAPLSDQVTIDLKAGDNDLYIKVIRHDGPSAFAFAMRSAAAPIPAQIIAIAQLDPDARTETQAAALKNYYRRAVSFDPDWLVLQDMAAGLRNREAEIKAAMPTTLVWRELESPRPAHLLLRGEYDKPGDVVPRQVLKWLANSPTTNSPTTNKHPGASGEEETRVPDRIDLAAWLVSDDHPLTARVAVNRFWQQLYGTGLVKTSEDFGAQGAPPSHPELLDNLAIDFRESGWNIKQLMKRLVMTAAYQRSGQFTQQQLAIDPNNRLLARGPRLRLDAETIRDSALFTSGLLVEKLGGPSVKPPQPAGLWEAVGYTSSNTATFKADEGDRIYRRSVYTFWKRTSAPPQMSTFDAPSRESCTARRERTNTPLQALLMMNEPQYLEAARKLADRSLQTVGEDPAARVEWMFGTVVSRSPAQTELGELMSLMKDLTGVYEQSPEAAKQLGVDSPNAAATMVVASTILNLDEAINK